MYTSSLCQFKIIILYTGAIMRRSAYPLSNLNYYIATPNCTGDEDYLLNCSFSTTLSGLSCAYEAGVICQGKSTFLSVMSCSILFYDSAT